MENGSFDLKRDMSLWNMGIFHPAILDYRGGLGGGDDGPLRFPWFHGELGGSASAAVWLRLEFDVFLGELSNFHDTEILEDPYDLHIYL